MAKMNSAYEHARKKGLTCISERNIEHLDPYLPVLDRYLEKLHLQKKKRLGLQEIMTSRIIGTCHESRTESFAFNFMPVLESDSEFAAKWSSLYNSALDEGLRDPIKAYELYGRYFVEEGNKRVSVTKFLGNPLISADVIELTLNPEELPDGELYEEYLKFYEYTGISSILLSHNKDYKKLLKILNAGKNHPFSEQERRLFLSLFYSFESVFSKMKDGPLQATSSDAFLLFLEVYGWNPDQILPDSELKKELEILWPAIEAWPDKKSARLMVDSGSSDKTPVLSFLREPVRAALIEFGNPETSSWTAAHEEGFRQMKKNLGDRVEIMTYPDADTPEKMEEAVHSAIDHGAQIIFTSHPMMLQMTNQFAAKYPRVKFLNCSLNPDTANIRSYYTRGYEVLFLQGMIAGALTSVNDIGFIADYPIYGALADINAFAIGVNMVRPDAKVYLDWSTTETSTNTDFPLHMDFIYIAGQDFDTRIRHGKRFGLFDVRKGKFMNISSLQQKWDVFYTRTIKAVLNRTYSHDEQISSSNSINYWLGLSNGLLDISLSDQLPFQTRRLVSQIKQDIEEDRFFVFQGLAEFHPELSGVFPLNADEIVKMDWLVSNIVGSIPHDRELVADAEKLVKVHGVDAVISDEEEDEHEASTAQSPDSPSQR